MRNGQLNHVLRRLRGLVAARQAADLPDQVLLERFVTQHDEAAFAAIVERHGPLVLGVCRRALRSEHHAEDACQATFLVLARKAASIRKREALGSWLHGVARRVAGKLQADVRRRAARDITPDDVPRPDPTGEITWREGLAVLDEELGRLPGTYRSALVLCYLEGKPHDEAARELGCSAGALRGRLERARERLRGRLVRRGVALPAALLGTTLVSTQSSAAVPPTLAVSTVQAAAALAAGKALAQVAPGPVATLTEGVLKTMSLTNAKSLLALLLTVGTLGAGLLAGAARTEPPTPQAAATAGREVPMDKPRQTANGAAGDQAATQEHAVRGEVRDVAGKPVAGARVYWVAAHAVSGVQGVALPKGKQSDPELKILAEGTTDAEGRAELRARYAKGKFVAMQLVAAAPGYGLAGKPFTDENSVALALRPEVKIQGELLTPAGAPARGVRVSLQGISSGRDDHLGPGPRSGDRPPPYWPAAVRTDDRGRFTLGGLPEGANAHLTVTHDDFAQEELYVSSAAPVSGNLQAFDIKPLKPDFKHTLSPARPVQGVVTAADTGKPMAGVTVEVIPWGPHGGMTFDGKTDAQGRYRVSGHAATSNLMGYTITAFPPPDSGYVPVTVNHDRDWPAGAKYLEKNLALSRGRLLHGRVLDADTGKPVAGASIVYQPHRSNPHSRNGYELRNRVLTDADGRFTVTGLAGKGVVVAEGPSPDYRRVTLPAGETLRGIDLFPHGFVRVDVPEEGEPAPAAIELRKGVTLQARVVKPDGSPLLWVYASCRQMNAVQIDRWPGSERFLLGMFSLRGADPDQTYRVFFVQPELHLGAVADLKYGGPPAEVRLQPTASVRGKLVSPDGTLPANTQAYALLLLTKEEGKLDSFDWFSGDRLAIYNNVTQKHNPDRPKADGSFALEDLIPGTRMYIVGGGGRMAARVPVNLQPGEVKDLGTLTLAKVEP